MYHGLQYFVGGSAAHGAVLGGRQAFSITGLRPNPGRARGSEPPETTYVCMSRAAGEGRGREREKGGLMMCVDGRRRRQYSSLRVNVPMMPSVHVLVAWPTSEAGVCRVAMRCPAINGIS